MIPLGMKSPEDMVKRRHPTGASSNGRTISHRRRVERISRMPSPSQDGNRKGLMSFTWHCASPPGSTEPGAHEMLAQSCRAVNRVLPKVLPERSFPKPHVSLTAIL